jgi:pimeloyl-ACP methyl ester carboxylesterase
MTRKAFVSSAWVGLLVAGTILAAPPSSTAGGPPQAPATVKRAISGTAAVNGASLYYELKGEGKPIVLVHGGNLDCRMWDPQFDKYARAFKVLRYDVRGFGRSNDPGQPFSSVEDLKGVMQALAIGRASIVGLSPRPDRAGLRAHLPGHGRIAGAGRPGLSGFEWPPESAARMAKIIEAATSESPEAAMELWLEDPYMAPAMENPDLARRIRRIAMDNTKVWSKPPTPETIPAPPASERLGSVLAPTLVVVGSRDVPEIQAIVELVAGGIRGAKKVVLTGAGHMVNMEKPAAFDAAVLNFLSNLEAFKEK